MRKGADAPDLIDELVGALAEANDQRVGLTRLASLPTESLEPEALVVNVLDQVVDVLGASRAAFIPRAPAEDATPLPSDVTVADPFSVAGDVPAIGSRRTSQVDLEQLASEARSGAGDDRSSFVTPGGILVASVGHSGRLAVIGGTAGTSERRLAEAAAAQLANALELADLHARALHDALVRTEHDRAAELARSVLSPDVPDTPGLDMAIRTVPARAAGGDLHLQVRHGDALWFAVGDVSGKGLPAAVIMAMTMAALGTAARTADRPSAVVSAASDQLVDYLSSTGRFVTLVVGRHRIGSHEIVLANAGHSPVLTGPIGGPFDDVRASAPPVGVLDRIAISDEVIDMSVGRRLIVASDGLVEQENPAGELHGADRFLKSLRPGAGEAVAAAFEAIDAWAAGEDPSDDRTLCVIDGVVS